jgi:hypothetical protein
MKKLVICIALFGLVGLTACTNNSPTPAPVPTVVPDEWSVATLTVSDSNPLVGAQVQVEALIYNNGTQAGDGTTVTFTASGGAFGDGSTQTTADTQNGRARVLFSANDAGNYQIRAEVQSASRSVIVSYQGLGGDSLQIYQPLVPNVGSFDGGETVILRGKGIVGPVEVSFTVEGIQYPAIVQEVQESVPLSADGQITVTTPFISAGNTDQNQPADVGVRAGVGTASEQSVVLPSAFTFLASAGGVEEPYIYALDPNFGRSQGGDQVTVIGRNLENATRFAFGFRGQELLAQVLSISQDGQQMLILTPRFSSTPLTAPETATASVTTPGGDFTLQEAFIVVADEPQPELASLAPIAGPLDGGTLVTLFGSGFQVPVQVTFGSLAATDVNVIDDQSPSDNDMITCLSPNYSQQGFEPPVTVDVKVTNMSTGKVSNTLPFTYGDNLFISGNSPSEGERGDTVLIFGSGFEDPLQVFFTGNNREVEVQSVSGTEIATRIPLSWPVSCGDRGGSFQVTLIESNQTVNGGSFTLLGNTPTVTSVEPVFVEEGDSLTIFGADFADEILVAINNSQLNVNTVTVVSESVIEVENVPPADELGITFQSSPCTAPGDVPGQRLVATPVNVSVTNLPGDCTDTLTGGVVYEPEEGTDCEPTPVEIETAPAIGDTLDFGQHPSTDPPTCYNPQDVTIRNLGGETAMNLMVTTSDTDRFPITGTTCPTDLAFDQVCTATVEFCPQVGDADTLTGTFDITYNGGGPFTIFLEGSVTP